MVQGVVHLSQELPQSHLPVCSDVLISFEIKPTYYFTWSIRFTMTATFL